MKKIILSLLCLVLLSGCVDLGTFIDNVSQPVSTAAASSPETANSNPIAPLSRDDLLFADDFSNERGGWSISQDSVSHFFYQDGEYHIEVKDNQYTYMSIAEQSFPSGILSVDVRLVTGGQPLSGAVLLWQYTENGNYYGLDLTVDGKFLVYRILDGEYQFLTLPAEIPALRPVESVNHVDISYSGVQFDIYLNGQFAAHVEDTAITGDKVGLGVTSTSTDAVEVAFDNLTLHSYSAGASILPQKPQPTPTPELHSITWDGLVQFLSEDHTNWNEYDLENYNCMDYAIDLKAGAVAHGIQARIVTVDFVDQETGHAFVEFDTSDRGPIFVEPQGDNTYSNVAVGNPFATIGACTNAWA